MQPIEICTHAWNSRSRFIGRWPVNPSNSKKPWAVMLSLVRNSASLCTCPGPNATSTNGNMSKTSSFSDCDQQPPTPTTDLRSLALRFAVGRLPLMAVGNWPVHRTFYFTPAAFENLFRVHLGWFDSIRFEKSATGLRRVVAYCHIAPDARERL